MKNQSGNFGQSNWEMKFYEEHLDIQSLEVEFGMSGLISWKTCGGKA